MTIQAGPLLASLIPAEGEMPFAAGSAASFFPLILSVLGLLLAYWLFLREG